MSNAFLYVSCFFIHVCLDVGWVQNFHGPVVRPWTIESQLEAYISWNDFEALKIAVTETFVRNHSRLKDRTSATHHRPLRNKESRLLYVTELWKTIGFF